MMKKALMLAVAGLMTLGTASAASASSGPALTGKASCPRSYVCAWDNNSFSGKPRWKSQGNIGFHYSDNGISIFNNGVRHPGGDHIRYYFQDAFSGGASYRGCLHYPGDSPTSVKSGTSTPTRLYYAKWGAEC